MLVASAFSSWTQPSQIARPSYADGVPMLVSHPSDLEFRLGAAALGLVALLVVAATRRRSHAFLWGLLVVLGLGAIALGLVGLQAVEHQRGFGSLFLNDMTLAGFGHGDLNYVELAGAALLCISPFAALRPSRN